MARPSLNRVLHVVFDTNALFTSSIHELMHPATVELMRRNSDHADLAIAWHVPKVVRMEREFQMRVAAQRLLPAVSKLESLVGLRWGVNEETIGPKVAHHIDKFMDEYKVHELSIDPTKVNWESMIASAANRIAPFENKEKSEKGFRDALILESYMQLVASLSSRQMAVLVTSDTLLKEAALARIKESPAAAVLNDLEGLRERINVLVSQVDAAFAQQLSRAASPIFYADDNPASLYVVKNVYQTITSDFADELGKLPPGAVKKDIKRVFINNPIFVKKLGARVHFSTRVEFDIEYSKQSAVDKGMVVSDNTKKENALRELIGNLPPKDEPIGLGLGLLGGLHTQWEVVDVSSMLFDVAWSASYTKAKRFSHPSIDGIQHVEDDFV